MAESFGERLWRLRRASGYSQEGLGREIGYSQPYISMWESDERVPVRQAIASIARLYGLSEAEVRGA